MEKKAYLLTNNSTTSIVETYIGKYFKQTFLNYTGKKVPYGTNEVCVLAMKPSKKDSRLLTIILQMS
jgi:hypothetical protein